MLLHCIAMIRFLISRIFWRLDVHLTFLVVLISLVYGGRYLFYRFHSYLSFHFPSFCLSYQPFSFSTPILIVSISIFLNRPLLQVSHLCNLWHLSPSLFIYLSPSLVHFMYLCSLELFHLFIYIYASFIQKKNVGSLKNLERHLLSSVVNEF